MVISEIKFHTTRKEKQKCTNEKKNWATVANSIFYPYSISIIIKLIISISPAYKISNDVSMTHIDFNTITNLVWICSVKMSPKCCFDAWTILKKLLKNKKISYTRQSVKKEEIEVMVYVQNNNLLTMHSRSFQANSIFRN